MASHSLLSEEQLLCPICLSVFVEPVSTPCGHNYCRSCLTSYWDSSSVCFCPVCKESFSLRPQLRVNTFISGLAQQFTSLQLCEEQTHTTVLCPQHQQLISFFCPNQGLLMCKACTASPSNQGALPLQQAYRQLRAELGGTEERVNTMIQEIQKTVSSIRQTVTGRQQQTKQLLKRIQDLAALVQTMEVKQQEADSEAEAVIGQIEQELKDLMETQDTLRDLKQTKDQHVFLQKYPLRMLPSQPTPVSLQCEEELQQMKRAISISLSQIQTYLDQITTLSDTNGASLRHVQQFAVDFTLDPKTAHHRLTLSRDLKQVRFNPDSNAKPNPGSNPTRFTKHLAVLGGRGFSSGRFYFEVFVNGKTEWITGVATASVQRKGKISHTPGCGVWVLCFRMNYFETFCRPNVPVHRGKMERVGVFVDYEGREVSFYDVNADRLVYSFSDCAFTEKLYPYFNPCNNEFESNLGPMVLVPVNQK